MKKYLKFSLIYACAALICGVFFREFTKWNGYQGVTALGKAHAHLLMMGTMVFLIVALFSAQLELKESKLFRVFLRVYNIGLPITAGMMVIRGITQVLNIALSKAADASISGIAGIGHLLTGAGIILLLLSLMKAAGNKQ